MALDFGMFPPADERDDPLSNSGVVSALSSSGFIQSIQYGSVTITEVTNTAVLTTEVVTSNSVVMLLGLRNSISGGTPDSFLSNVILTNGSTVTSTRYDNNGTAYVDFCVIEFQPGILKSKQIGSSSESSASIVEVDITKTVVFSKGAITTYDADNVDGMIFSVSLTDSTTVATTVSRAGTTIYFVVLEFN